MADNNVPWALTNALLIDGTGVPVVKSETQGRTGKTKGEPARTREAKIGSVFTQTTWDREGYAIRDSDSTSYVAAIETAIARLWPDADQVPTRSDARCLRR